MHPICCAFFHLRVLSSGGLSREMYVSAETFSIHQPFLTLPCLTGISSITVSSIYFPSIFFGCASFELEEVSFVLGCCMDREVLPIEMLDSTGVAHCLQSLEPMDISNLFL